MLFGKPDKMPQKVWSNVLMGQSADISVVSPPPFTFDWKEIERGLALSTLEEFSAYSGIAAGGALHDFPSIQVATNLPLSRLTISVNVLY